MLARPSRAQPLAIAVSLAAALGTPRAHAETSPVGPGSLVALEEAITRIDELVASYEAVPPVPIAAMSDQDHQQVLGRAEIEIALGHSRRALEMLMGSLAGERADESQSYVAALLFTSEILETTDDDVGAMAYAELALRHGGTPDEMAEAGARWFRLARRQQRLGRRFEIDELWKERGGAAAVGSDVAAQVAYEVAFSLRADGRRREAQAMLATVPSESSVGSRAAYLSGVLFVERGDLANGERWFSAIMDWPLPDLPEGHPQRALELDVREIAALSAARLRFERGDLAGADEAYRHIAPGSIHEPEACWERGYLDLEHDRRRGALKDVQCVLDLGPAGARSVEARFFKASLLAHLTRYADSIQSYAKLHEDLTHEHVLFAEALRAIDAPAELLFSSMERAAVERGARAVPGPATLFGDAWTPLVDRAYRVDRGREEVRAAVIRMRLEVERIREVLARSDAFGILDQRRRSLEAILEEIRALEDRASLIARAPLPLQLGDVSPRIRSAREALARLARSAEAQRADLARLERERRAQAATLLREIGVELGDEMREVEALEAETVGPANAVAREAIVGIERSLKDAAMRAEVGALDTYWLKKDHRTRAIQALLLEKKEAEDLAREAAQDAEEEMAK